jgi:hypothetical protein
MSGAERRAWLKAEADRRLRQTDVEAFIFLSILRLAIRIGSADQSLWLLKAAGKGAVLPAPPPPRLGLSGVLSGIAGARQLPPDVRLYALSAPGVASIAKEIAREDSRVLAKLRWCFDVRCILGEHKCRRSTGGPFYVDGARRPDRPSKGCCTTHTRQVERHAKRGAGRWEAQQAADAMVADAEARGLLPVRVTIPPVSDLEQELSAFGPPSTMFSIEPSRNTR